MGVNKSFFLNCFCSSICAIAGYSIYTSQKSDAMSDLMLANVEALPCDESGVICRTNAGYSAICNIYDTGAICPCGF